MGHFDFYVFGNMEQVAKNNTNQCWLKSNVWSCIKIGEEIKVICWNSEIIFFHYEQ